MTKEKANAEQFSRIAADTTRTTTLNVFQEDYIKAKTWLDSLYERIEKALEPDSHLLDDDAGIERYAEKEIWLETQLGLAAARKHFEEAQVNLFGWARRELERLDWKREGYHEIMALFEHPLSPIYVEKLADICLKMRSK